jgi:hypothetical protein
MKRAFEKGRHADTLDIQHPNYRKMVTNKLHTAVKKLDGVKGFGNKTIVPRIRELGYKMGATDDPKKACQLKDLVPRLKEAPADHLAELNSILDSVNRGLKSIGEFSKHKR